MPRLPLNGALRARTASHLTHVWNITFLCSTLTLFGAACDQIRMDPSPRPKNAPEAGPAPSVQPGSLLSDEDRAFLDQWKQQVSNREHLRTQPGELIKGGDPKLVVSDWSPYTRAEQIHFANTSRFDVSDIRGSITFITNDGQKLGTVPFQATGYVYAGETTVLDVKSNALQGRGERASIVVESVHVWN